MQRSRGNPRGPCSARLHEEPRITEDARYAGPATTERVQLEAELARLQVTEQLSAQELGFAVEIRPTNAEVSI